MALSRPIYIVGAKRTAFGAFGGKFKGLTATVLGKHAAVGALESANVDPALIDTTIFGNVMPTSSDGTYLSRHIGLLAGAPQHSTALTLNRLCGSGFQAIISAAQEIVMGDAEIALAGGAENMSQSPFVAYDIRFGTKLGVDLKLQDSLWNGLTDQLHKMPMGITAENLAEKYNLSREDCDAFALLSQQRWAEAEKNGCFKDEIVSIQVKGRKGMEDAVTDEHARPQTKPGDLSKLAPVFSKTGTVTAGNASGISDGASALVLASEEACTKHGLKPLARLVSYGVSGVDPKIMGIGPVPAITKALQRANLKLTDMALIEVNEAFAPQFLAVEKELGLDRSITNINGGAIALGHPVGASGARITAHLVHQLRQRNEKYAIGSACIGGGQGIAVVIESIQ